jgi:hypothetical protein
MGVGSIPISKIWQYMDRFKCPDWYEPVLLQSDAAIVSEMNSDNSQPDTRDNQVSGKG